MSEKEKTEEKRIVEINGVKLELDYRNAKLSEVSSYKVGDVVKLLKKEYDDSYKVHTGIIVGFEPFQNLPTIIVAYLKSSFSSSEIEFEYINSQTKGDVELSPAQNDKALLLDKEKIVKRMDRDVATKREEIEELEWRKQYFLENFGAAFEPKADEKTA